MHTAASPDVAFVMLVIALSLVVFEFFTAGVGVAAGTGCCSGVMAAYGLGVLPDARVGGRPPRPLGPRVRHRRAGGSPRFWTVVGVVAYIAGSARPYGGGQSVSLWIVIVLGVLAGGCS